MPSRSRRRETDYRSDRLESEIRSTNTTALAGKKRIPMCGRCGRCFEEQTKVCPRCDTKTMGYVEKVPDEFIGQLHRRAFRKAGLR